MHLLAPRYVPLPNCRTRGIWHYRWSVESLRDGQDVVIRLRYPEAVVLDRMLSGWVEQGLDETLPFEDQAEQRVLWDLTASLEPLIDEAFSGDAYDALVQSSRADVRDRVE